MKYPDFFALNNIISPENYLPLMSQLLARAYPPPVKDEFQQRGWEKLGEGYYLAPLPGTEEDREGYSNLYKGEEKLSDAILRKGGMGGTWKGDYINLITYKKKKCVRTGKPPKPTDPKPKDQYESGVHTIFDRQGNIVYSATGVLSYPYLQGGCILSENSVLINLKTGEPIVKYDGSIMDSDKFLFVSNKYNKDYPKGVYKIEFETGNFEIFEIIK
jgi:hypothetical protein